MRPSGKWSRRMRAAGLAAITAVAALLAVSAAIPGARAPSAGAASTIAVGTSSLGTNLDSDAAGSAEAFQATATATGSIGSMTVYVDPTSAASRVVVGLYADASGTPGNLLTSGAITSPAGGAWDTVSVPSVSVTSGTHYWISVLSPSGTGEFAYRDSPSGTLSENSSSSTLSTLPASWTAGPKWNNSPISAYASLVTGPTLSVSPPSVTMDATAGGTNPPPATLSVSNTGTGTLTYSATSDSSWLAVAPRSGTAPSSITVSVTTTGLGVGSYTGHVTVTASGAAGSPQVIPVNLFLTGPISPGQGDWPTAEHDVGRSGTATDETQIGPSNVGTLTKTWSAHLDGKVTAQPLYLSGVQVEGATHNVVIAATNQNTIYALDGDSGTVLWSDHLASASANCTIPGGFGITGAPVVDRATGLIYAVTDDGFLRTISLANGSQAQPALQVISSPQTNAVWGGLNLFNGNLFFPTGSDGCDDIPWQGGIYQVGVAGSSPQLLRHWITVPSLSASDAGGGIWGYGGVSIDSSTGHVYAASSDDGTNLTGDEGYTPYAGSMLALDQSLSLLGWYQPTIPANYNCGEAPPCDQDFASTPLIFQPPGCPAMVATGQKSGVLYVTSEANLETDTGHTATGIQAIQLNDTFDDLGLGGLSGTPLYDPATNMLYVSDTGSGYNGIKAGLVALSVQSNCTVAPAWSQSVGTPISNSPNSTPTLANGVVYVGLNNGSVSAYDASSGSLLWNSGSQGFAVYAAPIVANGEVIAGSWDDATSSAGGTITAWRPVSAPALGVSPTTLSFNATAGGSEPAAQTVTLANNTSGTLTFTAASNASWLNVAPANGNVPNTLAVSADITGLAAGTYTGVLTITPSTGSAQTVTVTLNVNPAPTVPGKVGTVTAAAGNGSATVSWPAPPNGGSPVTSYTVTPFAGTTSLTPVTVAGNPPATTTTVAGLTNGTSYTFTVAATNAVGTGPASNPSNPVVPGTAVSPTLDARAFTQATGTTATTPAFSTSKAGEVLVAFVSADGPNATQAATVSGAGLAWKLVARADGQPSTAEIWTATAASVLTNVTVTSTETKAGYHQLLDVLTFENSSGIGAGASANAAKGAPSVSLTTTRAGSVVYGVGHDYDNAVARTVGSNQSMALQWVDTSVGDTMWVQNLTNPVPGAGTVATVYDTAPTTDDWNFAAVEILGT